MSNYINKLCSKAVKSSRSDKEFLEKLENFSDGSKKNIMGGVLQFKVMIDMNGSTVPDLVKDFGNIQDKETKKEVAYSILQDYVNFMTHERPCGRCYFEEHEMTVVGRHCTTCKDTKTAKPLYASSVPIYLGYLKKYLRFFGILDGIADEDISGNVSMPTIMEEEYEPVTREMFRDMLEGLKNIRRRLFWHFIGTSGLRISEGCSLTKADFEFVDENDQRTTLEKMIRIRVNVKANTTKKRKQRKSYVAREIETEMIKFLTNAPNDRPIFVTSNDATKAKKNEGDLFRRSCKKLIEKYPVLAEKKLSGVSKISIHSLRSYFITCANRVDYGFGHALAGHKQYMAQYDRLTPEQKMQMLDKSDERLKLFSEIQLESTQQSRLVQQDMFHQFQQLSIDNQNIRAELADLKTQKMAQA